MKQIKTHHGRSLERLYRRLQTLSAAGVKIPRDERLAVKQAADVILYEVRKAERRANEKNFPPPGFGQL